MIIRTVLAVGALACMANARHDQRHDQRAAAAAWVFLAAVSTWKAVVR